MIRPRGSTALPMGRENWTLAAPDMNFALLVMRLNSAMPADHLAPAARHYAMIRRPAGCRTRIGPAVGLLVEVFSSP
jgi:hypothetical protein